MKKIAEIVWRTAVASLGLLVLSAAAFSQPPPLPGPPGGSGIPLGGLEYAVTASFLASVVYLKIKRNR